MATKTKKYKFDKSIKRAVRALALAYPKLDEAVTNYEQKPYEDKDRAENEALYHMNKSLASAIKNTFEASVDERYKRLVWDMFYEKRKPKTEFEKVIYDEMTAKWLYFLAGGLGYMLCKGGRDDKDDIHN